MSATVIYVDSLSTVEDATATTKGVIAVPTGNGLYLLSGNLYAYTATESTRGIVRLSSGGGLVNDQNSRLMVRDATNNVSGKVVPDTEYLGIVDGMLAPIRGMTEVRSTEPFTTADVDYISMRPATEGIGCFTGGACYAGYNAMQPGSSSVYRTTVAVPMTGYEKIARNADAYDEIRRYRDGSCDIVRRTAAMWFGGSAPYDHATGFNLPEFQRYWSQRGETKSQSDLVDYMMGKASELSGRECADISEANAYFAEHPLKEVLTLDEPVTVPFQGTVYAPEGVILTFVSGNTSGYGQQVDLECDTARMVMDRGYPTATDESPGMVRPDGRTIAVHDGVISAVGTGGPRWEIREDANGRRRLAIVIPEE